MVTVRRRLLALAGVLLAGLTLLVACAETTPAPPLPSLPGDNSAGSPRPPSNWAAVPPEQSFTVVATGDVLIHPTLTDQATKDGRGKPDFTPLFAGMRKVLSEADLALCHLEVPLADEDGPFLGYPTFSAPPELATALAAVGYDACSTASNHTMDQGPQGVQNTLDALDAARIAHTGSARSQREATRPVIHNAGGVRVGLLSFTFGFNQGTAVPDGKQWMANKLEVDAVRRAARLAKEAGADVVIAGLHWGVEDQHAATDEQRRIAKELLSDPAVDLIVGHHAHVVQPFEQINGKWVAYGLGNQVARHAQPRRTTEEGITARFRFTRTDQGWRVDQAEYLPTLLDLGPPIRLRDLTADREIDGERRDEALRRTDRVVLSLGAGRSGLTRPGS